MENKKSKKIVVRNKWDRLKVVQVNNEPSKTKQEFKQECDINYLMSRYQETGTLGDVQLKGVGQFGDFTSITNFKEAQDQLAQATQMFNGLPSSIRNRFQNSPQALLDFMSDPKANMEEGIKLGLFIDPKDLDIAKIKEKEKAEAQKQKAKEAEEGA